MLSRLWTVKVIFAKYHARICVIMRLSYNKQYCGSPVLPAPSDASVRLLSIVPYGLGHRLYRYINSKRIRPIEKPKLIYVNVHWRTQKQFRCIYVPISSSKDHRSKASDVKNLHKLTHPVYCIILTDGPVAAHALGRLRPLHTGAAYTNVGP